MQPPSIPAIEDDELMAAVSALTRAACVMRALFLRSAEGTPIKQVLEEHDEVAMLADAVIDKWRNHLGISLDDALIN